MRRLPVSKRRQNSKPVNRTRTTSLAGPTSRRGAKARGKPRLKSPRQWSQKNPPQTNHKGGVFVDLKTPTSDARSRAVGVARRFVLCSTKGDGTLRRRDRTSGDQIQARRIAGEEVSGGIDERRSGVL